MRYRKLDANGDYQFGHGLADFWYNVPDAVGQAIRTRMWLFRGEWFLNRSEGMPWGGFPLNDLVVIQGQVLGKSTAAMRDVAVKERVFGTPGVLQIRDYASTFDPNTRTFDVTLTVDTIYGGLVQQTLRGVFQLDVTPLDDQTGGLG